MDKLVFFLSSALICSLIILVIELAFVADSLNEIRDKKFDFYSSQHIERLIVDTIHAEEIEIFPLCDLNGDIVH